MKHLLLPVLGLLLSGCAPTRPVQVAAVVAGADSASRAELQQVISDALAVDQVALAENALMDSDLLIVARKRHVNLEVGLLDGRDLGVADQFRLSLSGGVCILRHVSSEREWRLTETRCRVLD